MAAVAASDVYSLIVQLKGCHCPTIHKSVLAFQATEFRNVIIKGCIYNGHNGVVLLLVFNFGSFGRFVGLTPLDSIMLSCNFAECLFIHFVIRKVQVSISVDILK